MNTPVKRDAFVPPPLPERPASPGAGERRIRPAQALPLALPMGSIAAIEVQFGF